MSFRECLELFVCVELACIFIDILIGDAQNVAQLWYKVS